MPAIYSYAPGKVILCGEHAVVYGQPAIAIPIHELRTKTTITAKPITPKGEVRIVAPGIELDEQLDNLPDLNPLKTAVTLVAEELKVSQLSACEIRITTSIPSSAGLGSSASVSVSLVRAVSQFLGHPLSNEDVNRIAFEVEKMHHGTPSGIDNTVITYERPVYYRKGDQIQQIEILQGFYMLIADCGAPGSTAQTVAMVREGWLKDKDGYETIFANIGRITLEIHGSLRDGTFEEKAYLLKENHQLLGELGVSTPALDALVNAAINAGALGAKLSGGGGGGNIIAITTPETYNAVTEACLGAGAANVTLTRIHGTKEDLNE